jgi:hypothetical protein
MLCLCYLSYLRASFVLFFSILFKLTFSLVAKPRGLCSYMCLWFFIRPRDLFVFIIPNPLLGPSQPNNPSRPPTLCSHCTLRLPLSCAPPTKKYHYNEIGETCRHLTASLHSRPYHHFSLSTPPPTGLRNHPNKRHRPQPPPR